jgi:hypothetical protein
MSGLSASDAATIEAVYRLYGPPRLRNCPLTPTPRQEAFLLLEMLEVFFGGAAGGGKSVALLLAALQYSDVPGHDALLLRPTLAELQLPGGLIDLSHDWLGPSRAHWESDRKLWRFPGPGRSGAGGATLGFGYLENSGDLGRYAGLSYSFLGFDELTRYEEQLYRRMFRVLRQPTALAAGAAAPDGTRLGDVPVRVRSASNPGGPGHGWVKQRFVDPDSREPGALFLPSRLRDNPYLDQHYASTLAQLPTAERERLLNGDWEIPDDGELFRREWFEIIDPRQVPSRTTAVRYWDLAGTEPSPANRDPDYTVGIRLEHDAKTGSSISPELSAPAKVPARSNNWSRRPPNKTGTKQRSCSNRNPAARAKQSPTVTNGTSSLATPSVPIAPPDQKTYAHTPSPPQQKPTDTTTTPSTPSPAPTNTSRPRTRSAASASQKAVSHPSATRIPTGGSRTHATQPPSSRPNSAPASTPPALTSGRSIRPPTSVVRIENTLKPRSRMSQPLKSTLLLRCFYARQKFAGAVAHTIARRSRLGQIWLHTRRFHRGPRLVSKTVSGFWVRRGFKSLPLRSLSRIPLPERDSRRVLPLVDPPRFGGDGHASATATIARTIAQQDAGLAGIRVDSQHASSRAAEADQSAAHS